LRRLSTSSSKILDAKFHLGLITRCGSAQLARLEAELVKLQTKQSRKASKSGAVIDLPAMRVAQ
jgi:hypothetical protein